LHAANKIRAIYGFKQINKYFCLSFPTLDPQTPYKIIKKGLGFKAPSEDHGKNKKTADEMNCGLL
tara:strand:- start:5962 stop:6156 length:195 start_codon:yes stop_codon:yes gene_type:complete